MTKPSESLEQRLKEIRNFNFILIGLNLFTGLIGFLGGLFFQAFLNFILASSILIFNDKLLKVEEGGRRGLTITYIVLALIYIPNILIGNLFAIVWLILSGKIILTLTRDEVILRNFIKTEHSTLKS